MTRGASLSVAAIDQIDPDEPHAKDSAGGVLTLIALAALATWTTIGFLDFEKAPLPKDSELKWTVADGPVTVPVNSAPLFPMRVACLAQSGCVVALRYSGVSTSSANCAAATTSAGSTLLPGGAVQLAQNEAVDALACYTDNPEDGFFTFHSGASPFGIGVTSTPNDWSRDVPMRAGRNMLSLVNTTNRVSGQSSAEWFPTFLSVDQIASAVGAVTAAHPSAAAKQHATQLVVAAQWTSIVIYPKNWLGFLSSVGGTWTCLLTVAALILAAFRSGFEEGARKKNGTQMELTSAKNAGASV